MSNKHDFLNWAWLICLCVVDKVYTKELLTHDSYQQACDYMINVLHIVDSMMWNDSLTLIGNLRCERIWNDTYHSNA